MAAPPFIMAASSWGSAAVFSLKNSLQLRATSATGHHSTFPLHKSPCRRATAVPVWASSWGWEWLKSPSRRRSQSFSITTAPERSIDPLSRAGASMGMIRSVAKNSPQLSVQASARKGRRARPIQPSPSQPCGGAPQCEAPAAWVWASARPKLKAALGVQRLSLS